ncbi:MAG: hypothetical protein ABW185_26300 [Sedimenticola sp.]
MKNKRHKFRSTVTTTTMSSTEKLDIRRYLKPAAAQGGGDSEKQSQSLDAAKSKATMGRSGDSNMTLVFRHFLCLFLR